VGGRPHPLRWRVGLAVQLDVLVVAVVLAMGAVIGTFFVRAEAERMDAALAARIRLVGAYVATSAESSWERDEAALDAMLTRIGLDPDVAYVLLKTAGGEVRAARWQEGTRGAVREFQFAIHRLDATHAAAGPFGQVQATDQPVEGEVAIGVDLAPLAAERKEIVWRTLAALLFAAGIAAVFGHVLVTFLLRSTLGGLLAGIRAFGAGDLGYRMRLDVRNSEIAETARAFDEMADRLASTLVSKAALEETVADRTRDLTRALEEGTRARDLLAEREARLRLLLDSTAEAIYGVDVDGRCTFANPACARLLGYEGPDALVGRDLHALVHHARPDGTPLAAADCPVAAALREARPYHSDDLTYWRADGTPVAVELWCYPVRGDGRLVGAVVTFLDVTEHRRLEGEVLNMRKLESLGVLAGGIAHDFNNMLTGILGNLSVALEQVPPGADLRELLEESEHAAKRARALTQQLLTFSKGGAPVKKVLSVRPVVEDAATFALRGAPVRGEFTSAPGLWTVEADAGQLAQVIQNLVINGVQAMPKGGTIAVACDNVELIAGGAVPLPPGRYVRIAVRDEGGGIAREHLSRIFDPYFTTKRTGSGLGLATVYAIVKKHGGHVSVSSRIGAGTTFEVWLPATGQPAGDEGARVAPAPHGRGRVLVMDDEELVRHTAGGMLATLGYEVLSAADGAEAVRLYESERAAGRRPDVVLMDLTVPGGVGGVEALERLRAIDAAVRAVATSGYSTDPVMSAHASYGFVGVLPKPYTLDDLARVIADAVTPAAGGAAPRAAVASSAS
jgi:PAS domain S-box-containing protein